MNDWVNCLRLVAFGQNSSQCSSSQSQSQSKQQIIQQPTAASQAAALLASNNIKRAQLSTTTNDTKSGQQTSLTKSSDRSVDVLLEKRTSTTGASKQATKSVTSNSDYVNSLDPDAGKSAAVIGNGGGQPQAMTASQAAAAAASALAKTRQRQPSLLGSCKPQPPNDSPFINQTSNSSIINNNPVSAVLSAIGQIDTLTSTVRGHFISTASKAMQLGPSQQQASTGRAYSTNKLPPVIQATLDEEEENMLYCSIENNPSEHNYRVKVIETELSLRCQLKCYQLTAPLTISQQYEQIGQFSAKSGAYIGNNNNEQEHLLPQPVTFYQLIIGPQELTLLNDYAAAASLRQQSILQQQQQGLWSWPYQCIRRYGFDKDNCFMFEAGRKCTSGPGQFIVQTPKAHQIYQDVVKFVNELRSLNNTGQLNFPLGTLAPKSITNATSSSNNLPQNTANIEEPLASRSIVTQIPVTWTPNNSNMGIDITASDTRQQFFDTLRQLDSSSSQSQTTNHVQQQINKICLDSKSGQTALRTESANENNNLINLSSNSSQETCESREGSQTTSSRINSISSISTNYTGSNINHIPSRISGNKYMKNDSSTGSLITDSKCSNSSPIATPEETDESGYEQGDDSVEDNASATSRLARLTSSATRKRQANDSMSSSSSTTSSSGGSPGHSVSRRSTNNGIGIGGANFNSQGPSKRPLLNTSPTTNNGATHSTESTKTVTNSNSSSASKIIGLHNMITHDQHEDFETNLIRDVYSEITKLHAKFAVISGSTEDLMSSNSSNAGSSDNCSGNSNEKDCESTSSALAEPMYSNLRVPTSGMLDQRAREQTREVRDFELENEENINLKSKFNPSRPQPDYHVDHDRSPLRNSYPMLNDFNYLSPQPTPHLPPQPLRGQTYTTMLNPIPEISEAPMPKQSLNNKTIDGKIRRMGLSTNHYVINDVQYAKISRNI